MALKILAQISDIRGEEFKALEYATECLEINIGLGSNAPLEVVDIVNRLQ